MNAELPAPALSRWQPLRAGLTDLFYYDAEEFWFHDGRLLLRGNNGTGKSKVLALMLPFLLDGDLSPHRVEPDADSKKRMEWNLLLGGAHPHTDRLGYTWLEFGRIGEDGAPRYLTIGCGLKAVSGRGVVRHWFFVTTRRPGAGLSLVDATGTALTRDRLIAAIDGAGTVYETARSYRRAVDEALFGLGDLRYGALVDLLVQLRQPQLSKRPSERALSDALTEALPPMDQAVLADVAEAFRALEEDREALRDMVEAQRSASAFLGHYRRYAQVASRRRAERPRIAQSAYEQAGAALRSAHEEEEQAARAVVVAQEEVDRLAGDVLRLRTQESALREAPEMRDARELDRLADLVRQWAGERDRRSQDTARAAARQEKAARALGDAQDALDNAERSLAGHRQTARGHAEAARAGAGHARQIEEPLAAEHRPDGAGTEADLRALRSEADRIVQRTASGIAHVETAQRHVIEAERSSAGARGAVEKVQGEVNLLAEQRVAAQASLAVAAGDLVRATAAYLAGLAELPISDPLALEADQLLWADTLDGPNPLREAVENANLVAAQALTELRADARARRARVVSALGALAGERDRLLAGEDDVPPPPHTRDPAARTGRAGAPLWRVVDFAPHLPDRDRAGLEAALEASGVLDAWVTPAGELLAAGTDDVLLRPGPPVARGTDLASVMTVAVDRDTEGPATAVPDSAVESILAAIQLGRPESGGEGETWVDVGGSFGIGVLAGRWRKDEADFIGAGARAAARRRRLIDLDGQITGLENERTGIDDELAEIDARDAVRARERSGLPDDATLQTQHRTVAELGQQHRRLHQRLDDTNEDLRAAGLALTSARDDLATAGTDVGLPIGQGELAAVKEALDEYRLDLRELWPAVDRFRTARRQRQDRGADATEADASAELAVTAEQEAGREWAIADERETTLRASVGRAVEALQRELAQVAELLRATDRDSAAAAKTKEYAVVARAKAEARKEERTQVLDSATQERLDAAAAFRQFARTGLIMIALPEVELPGADDRWAPDPTVRLARAIERDLAAIAMDDPAWASAQRRVNEEFKTLTDVLAAQGSTASAQMLEDGFVVEVVFRGRAATIPELVESLGAEVSERGRILDEREREVLENHLVNEVASTLQELMSQAERQVGQMNAELHDRPTSTGMRLRLRWIPREDGPAGLAEARRRLLRQSADAWSEQDRSAVGSFLQHRIADVRLASPTGTWLEHLTAALDYRAWNRFVIERFQNEKWHSATGPASGGERVLAASVPLFAAASSHYASAGNPHAPRLVMLDEAFAGVDDNARAKYLGLLAAFDLDVVMTSEREWGCYPEVPGLAIAQLSRVDGINAVLVTNWRWDGLARERRPRPQALISLPDSAGTADTALQGGLFEPE